MNGAPPTWCTEESNASHESQRHLSNAQMLQGEHSSPQFVGRCTLSSLHRERLLNPPRTACRHDASDQSYQAENNKRGSESWGAQQTHKIRDSTATIDKYMSKPSSSHTVGTVGSKPAATRSAAQRPRSVNSVATTALLATARGSPSSRASFTCEQVQAAI